MAENWRAIADSEVDPESPVTTSLAQAWRDNPEGIAAGVSGAPRIQTGAYDTGSVDAAAIGDGEVGASEITPGSISRSEMSMGTSSQSGTIPPDSRLAVTLTDGALFPAVEVNSAAVYMRANIGDASASASAPRFDLFNDDASETESYDVAWRYINA